MKWAMLGLLALLVSCSAGDNGAPGSPQGGGGSVATGGASSGGSVASGGSWASGGSGATGGATGGSGGVAGGSGGASPTDGGTCKTECLGNECGTQMPNLCGGTLDCGECGDNTDYCVKLTPVHQNAVKNAIEQTKTAHPEYFDANDTMGDSWKVLDVTNYRANLVTLMVAGGLVAIGDPNSPYEVRVRSSSETTAENFLIYTSAGYSAYKYTSTCTPPNF